MRVLIVGGGPAGLYFAILMKRLDPAHQVTVLERDGPNDTFGWGIVFSDQTFSYLEACDEPSFREIVEACETWDNVDVVHQGERIAIRGNKFSGVGRLRFLNILHKRCLAVGVDLRFGAEVTNPEELRSACDLLVGADGANSLVRRTYQDEFQPCLDVRANKYIWLGTPRLFHGLTLTFRRSPAGIFTAHSYKFNRTTSTFIVECGPDTWERAGFASMSERETCEYLGGVFEEDLQGRELLTNDFVKWLNFVLVKNRRWSRANVVLLGDALHTAHFSIGSGTKLALEDAIALHRCFERAGTVSEGLREFEAARKPIIESYQEAAFESLQWFENVEADFRLDPLPFAYRLMTRSKRITHEKLRTRDPEFIAAYEKARRS